MLECTVKAPTDRRTFLHAKRQMMLAWLQTTGNAGRPNLDRTAGAAVAAAAPKPAGAVAEFGGKTAVLDRLRGEQG